MSVHQTIVAAEAATCALCGAGPCDCAPNMHLCRIARARGDELITFVALAECICDGDVYTGTTIVIDPGAAA